MKLVFDSLYANLLASPALYAAIGGRWYPIEAPVKTSAPLIVVNIISDITQQGPQLTFEYFLIELCVMAGDYSTMQTVAELVKSSFDNATLTGLTDYRQVGPLARYTAQPMIIDNTYRYNIEYRLELIKL